MTFLHQAGAAVLLIVLTLCLQCAGLVVLIRWLRGSLDSRIHNAGPFRFAAVVTQSAAAVIVLHGLQVLLWASGYHWLCLPSWDSAFYFSANSYVTVGYSDVVLPSNWRMLGPLERITGVLMCGVTVSFLFAMVRRLVGEGRSVHKMNEVHSVAGLFPVLQISHSAPELILIVEQPSSHCDNSEST